MEDNCPKYNFPNKYRTLQHWQSLQLIIILKAEIDYLESNKDARCSHNKHKVREPMREIMTNFDRFHDLSDTFEIACVYRDYDSRAYREEDKRYFQFEEGEASSRDDSDLFLFEGAEDIEHGACVAGLSHCCLGVAF